ncbi:hypothetical protein FACS18948_6410 [Clostridia bacterium]|nr:hypothetical protein FACS18948_6410 [Clostridia bacterium]
MSTQGTVKFESHADEAKNGLLVVQKKALAAVGKFLANAAKSAAPVRSGRLKADVGAWARINKKTAQAFLEVGVYNSKKAKAKGLKPAPHAHLVNSGTAQRFQKSGHPTGAARANHFLQDVVEANVGRIREIEARYLPEIDLSPTFEDVDEEVTFD